MEEKIWRPMEDPQLVEVAAESARRTLRSALDFLDSARVGNPQGDIRGAALLARQAVSFLDALDVPFEEDEQVDIIEAAISDHMSRDGSQQPSKSATVIKNGVIILSNNYEELARYLIVNERVGTVERIEDEE